MPFKSKAQQRYMFARNPDVAEEFASKTPSIKNLLERVHPKGSIKNKPVSPAFKPGKKSTPKALTS